MKFKLIEKFDATREMVQEYMYDAMDELNNAPLEEYIQWFKNLNYYDEYVEQAITDAYIEACDYGMIKGVEKTRLTSDLKEYIESHADIIEDTAELMRQCPDHLQHELKILLNKLDESLNEELLTEATLTDIQTLLTRALAGTGCTIRTDVEGRWYIIETPLNNVYAVPVETTSHYSTTDYTKRRFGGNGRVVNGELFSGGVHLGRAYYGVATTHNHFDYDDIHLYQYGKYPAPNSAGKSLTDFVKDVTAGAI